MWCGNTTNNVEFHKVIQINFLSNWGKSKIISYSLSLFYVIYNCLWILLLVLNQNFTSAYSKDIEHLIISVYWMKEHHDAYNFIISILNSSIVFPWFATTVFLLIGFIFLFNIYKTFGITLQLKIIFILSHNSDLLTFLINIYWLCTLHFLTKDW